MAYRLKTRSTTHSAKRLTTAACSQLFAEQQVADAAIVTAGKDNVLSGYVFTFGASASDVGTYPSTYTSKTEQQAADQAQVNAIKAHIDSNYSAIGVTGTLNMSLYTLISGVAGAADVRYNVERYTGGTKGTCFVPDPGYVADGILVDATTGTYPTTATSKAAQLADDKAAVESAKAAVKLGTTILTIGGTYDYQAAIDAAYESGQAAGEADQLDADKAEVELHAASILNAAVILDVAGTFDVETWEATRNTSPGTGHVESGTTWMYHGSTLTGTLTGTGEYIPPQVTDTDIFAAGASLLNDFRAETTAKAITYARGEYSIVLAAARGSQQFTLQNSDGLYETVESSDFICKRSELVLNNQITLPAAGDTITESDGITTHTYKVTVFEQEPCFRWHGRARTALRIHTKLADEESES